MMQFWYVHSNAGRGVVISSPNDKLIQKQNKNNALKVFNRFSIQLLELNKFNNALLHF